MLSTLKEFLRIFIVSPYKIYDKTTEHVCWSITVKTHLFHSGLNTCTNGHSCIISYSSYSTNFILRDLSSNIIYFRSATKV